MSKYDPNHVILVNEQDEWLGTMDKLEAHQKGALHRAISVFICNSKGEMLLQQRAHGKYHSGGLWSNACCSHPMPGESSLHAATRRVREELGIDCIPEPAFNLRYEAEVNNGLIENEYDHIYTATSNDAPQPDAAEVAATQYITIAELHDWMQRTPQDFTPWFHLAMPQYLAHLRQQIENR